MDPFFYEIVAAPAGRSSVPRLEELLRSDADLVGQATVWSRSERPLQSDLYVLLVVVTDDLAQDASARQKINYASGCGFPVIGVVEDLGSYDFAKAPLVEIAERNAESFGDPARLRNTLLHHAGIRLFGSGGRVFISYARKDGAPPALEIREALLGAGIGQSIDVYEFPGGEVIQEEIAERIRTADLVVLVDSQGASRSRWVAEETDIALAAHVQVVAVTPAANGFHHALQPHHINWSDEGGVAPAVLAAARRILARKTVFRCRVQRILARLSRLRDWRLAGVDDVWTVHAPLQGDVMVSCVADAPRVEDVIRLKGRLGQSRGLLVAGVRPFQRETAEGLRAAGGNAVYSTPLQTMAAKIVQHIAARPLAGQRVFLSAAMPSDPDDVDRARGTLASFVVSFTQSLMTLGATLVFGGHPSVTPLVHRAIKHAIGDGDGKIELHQARAWEKDEVSIPLDVREGPLFRSVRRHGTGSGQIEDLMAMRDAMIAPGLTAAVFVGGKTAGYIGSKPGIVDEYERFLKACSGRPAFVVGLAGGAAAGLPMSDHENDRLLRSMGDPDLAVALIVAELIGE